MSEKLKPCPFCGGSATLISNGRPDSRRTGWKVFCDDCGIATLLHTDKDKSLKPFGGGIDTTIQRRWMWGRGATCHGAESAQ